MREHLYRGKRVDNGEWVYGCYVYGGVNHYIVVRNGLSNQYIEVLSETVGEFTGLLDKNGKKIFEGDILRLCYATYPIKVFYDGLGWKFLRNKKLVKGAFDCDIKNDIERCGIIGNIYETPELLI